MLVSQKKSPFSSLSCLVFVLGFVMPLSASYAIDVEKICPSPLLLHQRSGLQGPPPSKIPEIVPQDCPSSYRDQRSNPPDLNVTSCHSVAVACDHRERPLHCGKRALEAGDWEKALESFLKAPDSCEAYYGRYLSRLFRLYANANNQFFSDNFETDYNHHHMVRDLYSPISLTDGTLHYWGQFACLARDSYWERPDATTLIDEDLQRVWDGDCKLTGPDGGPLLIRFTQGRCEAPLFDAVVWGGVWDRVDAALLYQYPYGAVGPTIRMNLITNLLDLLEDFFMGESRVCPVTDVPICGELEIDGVEKPRLPDDSERFFGWVYRAAEEISDPRRSKRGVFFWVDNDQDGVASAPDSVYVRACDFETGEPVFDLSQATVAATWDYQPASLQERPAQRKVEIFCGGEKNCSVYENEGEIRREEVFPLYFPSVLSPDGTHLAYMEKTADGKLQLFVAGLPETNGGRPRCDHPRGDCCITCDLLPEGISSQEFAGGYLIGDSLDWIPNPQGRSFPPLGIVYQHTTHPSGWGWPGQAQGTQFFAIRPDGTGNSPLLPQRIPTQAFNYIFNASPDGKKLFWTSTWNPATNTAGPHNLLIADLVDKDCPNGWAFCLQNIHSILRSLDHGWYESNSFAPDYPQDRRIFFTSSSHSMQSTRGFVAQLDSSDVIEQIYKFTYPTERPSEPFRVDFHPGWYEHFWPVDHGRQVLFVTSDGLSAAPDRYDWFLSFPPYLEAVLLGLTPYEMRFGNGLDYAGMRTWISNIDWSDREVVGSHAEKYGWKTDRAGVFNGDLYFIQNRLGLKRYGVIRFLTQP